jgi:hypothetical protein
MSDAPYLQLKLDPSLYNLKDDEKAFLKHMTKIEDEEELKEHVLSVQQQAFEVGFYSLLSGAPYNAPQYHQVHPYPCIQGFRFLTYVSSTSTVVLS